MISIISMDYVSLICVIYICTYLHYSLGVDIKYKTVDISEKKIILQIRYVHAHIPYVHTYEYNIHI